MLVYNTTDEHTRERLVYILDGIEKKQKTFLDRKQKLEYTRIFQELAVLFTRAEIISRSLQLTENEPLCIRLSKLQQVHKTHFEDLY